MRQLNARTPSDLSDLIAAFCPHPEEENDCVAQITLWDARFVLATRCREHPTLKHTIGFASNEIRPYAQALVEKGTPFTIQLGLDHEVSTLKWTIVTERP